MYTRCPQCQTVFRITSAQLKARAGQVRCGRCQAVFQGDRHLVDRPERKVERPAGAPRRRTPRKGTRTEAGTATTPGLDTAATAAVASPRAADGEPPQAGEARSEAAPSGDTATPALLLRPRRSRTAALLWGLGSLLLLLVLAAQAVLFYGAQMVRQEPALKPLVELVCRHLPCRHSLVIDMHRLELLETQVTPHPRYDRALRIQATLVNRAEYVQPYPLLEVTLIDTRGQVVSRRAYRAAEYLRKDQRGDGGLLPQVAVTVRLDITSPGPDASGYEILLLPPSE